MRQQFPMPGMGTPHQPGHGLPDASAAGSMSQRSLSRARRWRIANSVRRAKQRQAAWDKDATKDLEQLAEKYGQDRPVPPALVIW